MSSISLLLLSVHKNVHDFPMKMNYSEPKMYTGGVDISKWSKLTTVHQNRALQADWYIYYSFRDPFAGKLKRQPNIKAGANKFKNKKERFQFLKSMKNNLSMLLQSGFNPYEYDKKLEQDFKNLNSSFKDDVITSNIEFDKKTISKNEIDIPPYPIVVDTTISEAFQLALGIKKSVLAESSYPKFKSRINRFRIWIEKNKLTGDDDINKINKKTIIQYLNTVLQESSAINRNNSRTDLSSLFQALEDNELIKENFVKKINVLKSTPKRHKIYTSKQLVDILDYLRENDPLLFLFVLSIYYGFLRPIEICRLKIGDIDASDKRIYVKAKNKPVKVKILPRILCDEIPDLKGIPTDLSLFTPNGIGAVWDLSETYKRDYFTKRFKKVKDHFGLGIDYGLYSFRHTATVKVYMDFIKTMTSIEARYKLMLITGHATIRALNCYLRDIDAELPGDFSESFLNKKE